MDKDMGLSYLVFALGPVQGFIAQSRRTADGWIGSYLLSYLAGKAVVAVENTAGLELLVPHDKALMLAATRTGDFTSGDPTIAALPNTMVFKMGDGCNPAGTGGACDKAVHAAWKALTDEVWTAPLDRAPSPRRLGDEFAKARDTWDTQLARLWDTYWAWGGTQDEAFRHLAACKALRKFDKWEEDGDRCTVCSERTPLRDVEPTPRQTVRDASEASWREWQKSLSKLPQPDGGNGPRTLVRPQGKERLCAVCLVKRLIPWVDNPVRHLWGRTSGAFPSTSTMCTVHYRVDLLTKAAVDDEVMRALETYDETVTADVRELVQPRLQVNAFPAWKEIVAKPGDFGKKGAKLKLDSLLRRDGDYYLYGESVANELELKKDRHLEIARHLADLRAKAGVAAPPIYYALLVMDGDSMGDFFNCVERANSSALTTTSISEALDRFARDVPEVVKARNGQTIFAGGDDVVAMLPFGDAIEAALAIRERFVERLTACCAGQVVPPTISAALVYAHHQAPLGRVIAAGHTVLADYAKTIDGKDAIAFQRFMRGGPGDTFAVKWQEIAKLQRLVADLGGPVGQAPPTAPRRELAHRAAYGIRRFAWMLGRDSDVITKLEDRDAFVAALLSKSRPTDLPGSGAAVPGSGLGGTQAAGPDTACTPHDTAHALLELCDAADSRKVRPALSPAPLVFARFLAGGGRLER